MRVATHALKGKIKAVTQDCHINPEAKFVELTLTGLSQ